jgi:protein-L-isoaspartate(D-aspartate) O-methyltransferase
MTKTSLWLLLAAIVMATMRTPTACRGVEPDGRTEESRRVDADVVAEERRGDREALAALLAQRGIRDQRVLDAIGKVPRHRFVGQAEREAAYEDRALPIAARQTISQPYIVAYMTELLELGGDEHVLEVGTGSGYQAAVLAEVAERVYSVEIIAELSQAAAGVLEEAGYENIELRVGDGYAGWPELAPFDAIIVTAAASRVPEPLIDQLAPGGRLVLPLESLADMQWIWIVEKDDAGVVTRRRTIPVRFVQMTGDVNDPQP